MDSHPTNLCIANFPETHSAYHLLVKNNIFYFYILEIY